MNLSAEQLKHDRINLGRLVKRLESTIQSKHWTEDEVLQDQEGWVKAQGMAQAGYNKIRYARQLLLNVDNHEEPGPQGMSSTVSQQAYFQKIRESLDRLDSIVDVAKQRLEPEPLAQTSYLSLVPLPMPNDERLTPETKVSELSPAAELIPSDDPQPESQPPVVDPVANIASDLLSFQPTPHISETSQPFKSQTQQTPSLLSSSLQTHEELSNELARMATQLKRNAQHFSNSLEKDKSLVLSAAEVLEKNHDAMTKERVRLRDHRSKSFGTTWMVFGAIITVAVAWVFMFLLIRVT